MLPAAPHFDPAQLDAMRRSSGLTVGTEGEVLHEGTPFVHQRLAALLQAGLDLHPDSGEAILRVGEQWCYVGCDASPFVATRAKWSSQGLALRLNTGLDVTLPADALFLQLEGDHRLWVRLPVALQGPARWARLGRSAWMAVAEHLTAQDGDGQLVLVADDVTVPVARVQTPPC